MPVAPASRSSTISCSYHLPIAALKPFQFAWIHLSCAGSSKAISCSAICMQRLTMTFDPLR